MKSLNFLKAFLATVLCMVAVGAEADDSLKDYKLNLADTTVCKVYYYRSNLGYRTWYEYTLPGQSADGSDSIVTDLNSEVLYATDGLFTQGENFNGSNQGFLIFDFGPKGVDLKQLKFYNDGWYDSSSSYGTHQGTTVYAAVACSTASGETEYDWVTEGYTASNSYYTLSGGWYGDVTDTTESAKIDVVRSNGELQNTSYNLHNFSIVENKWVTGATDSTWNDAGYLTIQSSGHEKYRYVMVYDWSNAFHINEVEMWGILLDGNTKSDAEIDLGYAIAAAKVYLEDYAFVTADLLTPLQTAVSSAEALLAAGGSDEDFTTQVTALTEATTTFMTSITYELNDGDVYCRITTPDGMYGLALATEQTTNGSYTGYELVLSEPDAATNFSVVANGTVNGQTAYKFSTTEGTIIQVGEKLMLVPSAETTSSNIANAVFSMRYDVDGIMLYDMKIGDYYYYVSDGALATTTSFPISSDYESVVNYMFQLEGASYAYSEEEAAACFAGWEFNDAATTNYERFGNHSGNIVDGWRLNKWRMYANIDQYEINDAGYAVLSIKDYYYALTDSMATTPIANYFEETMSGGWCREGGQYANYASPDPIDQVRDSTYLITVNPYYTPYIAVKMAVTDADSCSIDGLNFSFFISKGGVEPSFSMSDDYVEKRGDVYIYSLASAGCAVGQIGYSAQYIGGGTFETSKAGIVIDWIRTYASLDEIPEESIPTADLEAIEALLPGHPVQEAEDPADLYQEPVDLTDSSICTMTVYDKNNDDVTETYAEAAGRVTDGDTSVSVGLTTQNFVVFDFGPEGITLDSLVVFNNGTDQQTHEFAAVYGDCSEGEFTESWSQSDKTNCLRTNGTAQNSFEVTRNDWTNADVLSYCVSMAGKTYRYVAVYNWSAALKISELKVYGTPSKSVTDGVEAISVDENAATSAIYNLAGQRVLKPSRGLYIVDGKKVIVK